MLPHVTGLRMEGRTTSSSSSSSPGAMSAGKHAWEFFVDKMKSKDAADIKSKIKSLLTSLYDSSIVDDVAARMIRTFLESRSAIDPDHCLWKGVDDDALRQAREGLEKFIMIKMYPKLFQSTPSARKRDAALFDRMTRLSWVCHTHLDIPEQYAACAGLQAARHELQNMNSFKPPRDKMVCILNCMQIINNAIASCQSRPLGAPPSADDFLPLLILVILQARPLYPFLNMQYISTFSHPDEMVGANGYMFTHFSSALTFIENMTASALHNCNQEEFDRRINGEYEDDDDIQYRFVDAVADDLRLSDIPDLLREYKAMAKVLRGCHRRPGEASPAISRATSNMDTFW
ncbi:VPS9 domain-containing protein [Plasmodiophora brassicae]